MERRLHRRKVECYNEPALTSPQRTSFGDTLGTDASGSACRVSNENSNASGRTDNNALRGTAFPNERRDRSFAYLGMEASRNERLPLGDHHVSGAVRTSPMNATSVQSNVRNKYVRLELGIQKIVLKSDSVEMENQASLLLGAVYQLKVHYGGNSSCTRSVTCQDTKRIVYADYMSFLEEMYDGEKLRFSLWEDDKQVAGFSLNPAKFRVPADTRKEYAVPFRYYPTRQMAFLEVTVQRTAMDNSFNDALAHESAKEALETLKKIQASSLAASKLNRERQERIRGLSERDQFTSPCQEHDVVANREEAWARADTGRLRVAAGDNIWQGKGRQMTSAKRCDDRAAGSNACGQRSEAGSDASFAVCSNRAGRHLFRNEGLTRVARRGESDKNSIETKTNAFSHAAGGDTSRSTSAQYQGTNDSSNGPMHCTGVNYSGCATTPLRSRIGLHGSAGGYRPYNDANVLDLVNDGGAEDSRASSRRRVLQRASPNRRIADRLVNSDDLGLNHLSPGRKRGGRCPGMGTSLMDEWLEWRLSRRSTYGSRAGSANSAFTGDDSVGSVYSHNHAASPRPTRSLANVAEMRPYTPLFTQQSFLSGRSRKR
ncbi:hypothetical protein ERJ75_000043200 [Trypanosoma vivax]|nr:hypothetical protein ERJ75_000043200 [Trypanosoma vivax]